MAWGGRRWKLEQELLQGQLSEAERREVVDELEAREREFTRLQRQRMSAADFEPLTLIGRGAFGEVRLGPRPYRAQRRLPEQQAEAELLLHKLDPVQGLA